MFKDIRPIGVPVCVGIACSFSFWGAFSASSPFILLFISVSVALIVYIVMVIGASSQKREDKAIVSEFLRRFGSSDTINQTLSHLAKDFDSFCQQERKLQTEGVDQAEELAQLITQQLQNKKRDFWEAHALARQFGFSVRPKMSDYLKPPAPARSAAGVEGL